MTQTVGFTVRPYEDADEEAVLALLQTSMGDGPAGPRTREFFRWKHLNSPFGRSYMILATAGSELIGLRAFMRWEFHAGGRRLRAVRAVDTATHPDWRGRGVFSQLTLAALEDLAADTDFVFNTPNDKSLPGYLKMGWQIVGRLPVWIRLARPISAALHAAGRPLRPLENGSSFPSIHPGEPSRDGRITTPRSESYLAWRYAAPPGFGYRAVQTHDGSAIYRVRPRSRLLEATVTEVLAGDARRARQLLRAVRRSSGADHIALHAASHTPARLAASRGGFIRARGPIFVVRPLAEAVEPDPCAMANWSLSIGDVEVF